MTQDTARTSLPTGNSVEIERDLWKTGNKQSGYLQNKRAFWEKGKCCLIRSGEEENLKREMGGLCPLSRNV